jgi:NitT/TauT family transport system substrate-binding protein
VDVHGSWSRRSFVSLATAFAVAPRVAQAQSSAPTLRLASAPDDDVTPFLYAQSAGLFRREGLDVHIQASNSGAAVAAAVAGGSIDIGKSSMIALISAHARGLPFVVVAPAGLYSADEPRVAMLVAKDATLRAARDLAGKTVAVPALGDLYAIANAAFVEQDGGDPKTVRYLEMPSAASPQAIIDHRVDAATLTVPILLSALDTGKVRILGHPFSAIAKRFIQAGWFTTPSFLAQNREIVTRFARVMRAASSYANGHHAETAPLLAAFTRQDPALVARMPRTIAPTALDPALVQPLIDAAARYGAIPSTFDARTLIDAGVANARA